MRKRLKSLCCLICLLLLVACAGGETPQTAGRSGRSGGPATTALPKEEREAPSLWTYGELAALNDATEFRPTDPREGDYVLVMSDLNLYENKGVAVISETEKNVQMEGMLTLLLQLQQPELLEQKEALEPFARALGERELDRLPLTMAIDPNRARYLIEYRVSYPGFTEYADPQEKDAKKREENKVQVFSCQLELTAIDAVSGQQIGTVRFLNDAQGNINIIREVTAVYREVPMPYESREAERLVDFLLKISK